LIKPKKQKVLIPCFYCGELIPRNKITKDHKQPQSRGGGAHGNLVKACKPCNCDKGALTLEEYRLVVAFRKGKVRQVVMPFPGEMASRL